MLNDVTNRTLSAIHELETVKKYLRDCYNCSHELEAIRKSVEAYCAVERAEECLCYVVSQTIVNSKEKT